MFMRVNSKCAHQLRPPPGRVERNAAVGKPLATFRSPSNRARPFEPKKCPQRPIPTNSSEEIGRFKQTANCPSRHVSFRVFSEHEDRIG